MPQTVRPISSTNLENAFAVAPHLYSGGSPLTEAAFTELQKLGIKTILSVDGAKPELNLARKFGFRYIHLPIGYDGPTRTNAVRLVKAAQSAEGLLYIHCHHGKHRGPAAAALICQSFAEWTPGQAVAWMEHVGTSRDYPQLFEKAVQFKPPSAQELSTISTNFPDHAEVSSLVVAMVAIDHHWDNLRAIQKAGFKPPANHPDLDPAREAILLTEAYRELLRSADTKAQGPDFLSLLQSATENASALHGFLKQTPASAQFDEDKAKTLFQNAAQSCASCHKKFRN